MLLAFVSKYCRKKFLHQKFKKNERELTFHFKFASKMIIIIHPSFCKNMIFKTKCNQMLLREQLFDHILSSI